MNVVSCQLQCVSKTHHLCCTGYLHLRCNLLSEGGVQTTLSCTSYFVGHISYVICIVSKHLVTLVLYPAHNYTNHALRRMHDKYYYFHFQVRRDIIQLYILINTALKHLCWTLPNYFCHQIPPAIVTHKQ